MSQGSFNNFYGTGVPSVIAATVASASGDLGDVDGDAVVIINEAVAGSIGFVVFSTTASPTASASTAGCNMIPGGGWCVFSRPSRAYRYWAVILASGSGNVLAQIGRGG